MSNPRAIPPPIRRTFGVCNETGRKCLNKKVFLGTIKRIILVDDSRQVCFRLGSGCRSERICCTGQGSTQNVAHRQRPENKRHLNVRLKRMLSTVVAGPLHRDGATGGCGLPGKRGKLARAVTQSGMLFKPEGCGEAGSV